MKPVYLILLVLSGLLAACSHDAKRENPLDPELTPAVTLAVAVDDTKGTAMLSWSRYAGDRAFAAYLVLRSAARSTVIDTLARFTLVDSLAFIDNSLAPDSAYEYRVAVVNEAGFTVISSLQRVDGFTTTAVALQAPEADAPTGQVTLRWSRYRDPGFERYVIFRRQVGADNDEEIGTTIAVMDTSFADSTARHAIDYLYRVVVDAAGQHLSSASREARVELQSVGWTSGVFDAPTATAELTWTPYQGPRFDHYELVRLTAGEVPVTVAMTGSASATTSVDSALLGNRTYSYQVVVVTTAEEHIESELTSGGIHAQLDSWPVDLAPEAALRLYASEGQIAGLVSTPTSVRLLSFGNTGTVLQTEEIYESFGNLAVKPSAVSLALGSAGERHVIVGTAERVLVVSQSTTGSVAWRTVFTGEADLGVPSSGEVAVGTSTSERTGSSQGNSGFAVLLAVDSMIVTSGRQVVTTEGFIDGVSSPDLSLDTLFGILDSENRYIKSENPHAAFVDDSIYLRTGSGVSISGGQLEMAEPGVEIDAWLPSSGSAYLQISGTRFTVSADDGWLRLQALGGFLQEHPYQVFAFHPYHLRLAYDGPIATYSLAQPFVDVLARDVSGWSSAIAIDGLLAYTVDAARFTLATDEEAPSRESPASLPTSDIDTWDVDGRSLVAMCQPESHRVLIGRFSVSSFSGAVSWPNEDAQATSILGSGFGSGPGQMAFPLAYARSADGRQYVLDAGNQRVQVFDADGSYLTAWQGGDDGPFDFGGGHVSTDFSGSIVVDDDGFIYVADVGNRRMQKFAP